MGLMALLWAALIGSAVWLFAGQKGHTGGDSDQETALDILNRRYARGEISKDEYERIRRDISGG